MAAHSLPVIPSLCKVSKRMSRFTLSKAFERSIEWRMREVFESSRSISIRRVMESRAPSCGLPAFCRWWGLCIIYP